MQDDSEATLVARLRPRPAQHHRTSDEAPPPPAAGGPERWIAGYRLLELLGEGGMGTVHLAEQYEPVRRTVALKLMRSSLTSGAARARFSAERQALARLSHPNVAAMYDAGATEAGFPYFAMECITGPAVVDYCDGLRLPVRARVELFIQICRGVQHAHQKGVIHRDLKPSNVLVTQVEGRPVPKIIDFGVAKALDQPLSEATALMTGQGVIGTPAYMSPEALNGDDVDTRTDVYALGVILYELLAGVRPHKTEDLPLGAVIRTVTEQEPPAPRAVYRDLSEESRTEIAAVRGEDARALDACLAGDLGWIARKAIAREREDRYGSAADLAADLTRYLTDEAVDARPPSLRYRATKFARRHRAGVLAGAVVFLTILGGIAGTTIGMLRAQRARSEAEAVSKFLTDLLDSASPWNRRNDITVRELLGEAAARITRELGDQPAARAQLLETIGASEFHLGHLDNAERLLTEAAQLRARIDGVESVSRASVLNTLGLVHKHQDRLDDAERLLRESLAIREKAFGRERGPFARGLFDLGTVHALRGKHAEAERAFLESLMTREKLFAAGKDGVDGSAVAMAMNGLGQQLARMNRFAEAEALIRKSLALRRGIGDTGYAYALSQLDLSGVLAKQNRFAEAEALAREANVSLRNFVEPDDYRLVVAAQQLEAVRQARSKED